MPAKKKGKAKEEPVENGLKNGKVSGEDANGTKKRKGKRPIRAGGENRTGEWAMDENCCA